uniref:Uncharacterized protein n=1 Tax=Lepeophtheirus salmonis TaxID=72036 RepID=A0A0K2TV37_LEPSM
MFQAVRLRSLEPAMIKSEVIRTESTEIPAEVGSSTLFNVSFKLLHMRFSSSRYTQAFLQSVSFSTTGYWLFQRRRKRIL